MGAALVGTSMVGVPAAGGAAGTITTVAGNGSLGFCGDGGPAISACIFFPEDDAVDARGRQFIVDGDNNRIRRVAHGIIRTIAGNGKQRFCGDGRRAVNACLRNPEGVAVDAQDNVYIADTENYRIRKIDPSGFISTIAGTGVSAYCGDNGPAIDACLRWPMSIAVDASGDVFFSDVFNDRIRKIDSAGVISTVAGRGTDGFCGDGGPAIDACLSVPEGIALDAQGDLYIADARNDRIRRVRNGMISTVAGNGTEGFCGDGGPAVDACLDFPRAVGVDHSGAVYVVDTKNRRVRRIDEAGTIRTFAGGGSERFCGDGGPPRLACLSFPSGVTFDARRHVYIADSGNGRIREVFR